MIIAGQDSGQSKASLATMECRADTISDLDGAGTLDDRDDGSSQAASAPIVSESEVEMRIRRDERDQFARELHNSTTQLMTSLDLQLLRLGQLAPATKPDSFVEIVGELAAIVTELHDSVRALGDPELFDPTSLVTDLAAMAAEFELHAGVAVRTAFGELPAGISSPIAAAIYRVAQEALANACRHGKAKAIMLSLTLETGAITLRIVDDGLGFAAPSLTQIGGHGLINMSARMNELGGSLTIHNLPAGAMVEASIPLGVKAR